MKEQILSFRAKPGGVDMATRTIKGAILAEVGEAKGHGFSVEQKFINDLVADTKDNGLLSNFGHNYNNMGLQLGRATGISVKGTQAVGDLTIFENADNSPKFPKMGTWVLKQAAEAPDSIMLSIRFQPSHFYQYDTNGKEITLRQDWYGDPIAEFKEKPIYVGFRKAFSVDVVDEGAITQKMFSDKKDFSLLEKLREIFGGPKNEPPKPVLNNEEKNDTEMESIKIGEKSFSAADITAMQTELALQKQVNKLCEEKITALSAQITEKDARIAELSKQPAAALSAAQMPDANAATDNAPLNTKKVTAFQRANKFRSFVNNTL